MVIDQLGDGRTVIRHPPTGPTIRYGPLERLYRVPWDDPPRVVVASSATPRRRRGTTRPACTSKGRVSPR
jgi:hypothetical protein